MRVDTVGIGAESSRNSSPANAAEDGLEDIDAGDTISLFAVSPSRLFVHWNFARDPVEALVRAFGDAASQYRLAVRSVDLESGEARIWLALAGRSQWLDALPGRLYRADVGFHGEGLPFISVLSSPAVRTTLDSVSPRADSAPQFHVTVEQFSLMLKGMGCDLSLSGLGSSEHNIEKEPGRTRREAKTAEVSLADAKDQE